MPPRRKLQETPQRLKERGRPDKPSSGSGRPRRGEQGDHTKGFCAAGLLLRSNDFESERGESGVRPCVDRIAFRRILRPPWPRRGEAVGRCSRAVPGPLCIGRLSVR
jgi:hypothetical protein